MTIKFTYSSYKTFNTCPRQYEAKYVLKNIKFVQTEAGRYGDDVHKAIEDYIGAGAPFPLRFDQFLPMIQPVMRWQGDKFVEKKMALDADLKVCDYYSPEYFVRGKADFICINGTRARCLDWKTSATAKYADIKQNELMALMIFKHYPEVETVDTGLVFLAVGKVIKAKFKASDAASLWLRWMYEVKRVESCTDSGKFEPKPSGLCRAWCDVITCEHNVKTRF